LKREKKKYLDDESVQVPRSTLYRWKKQRLNRPSAQKLLCYSDSSDEGKFSNCLLAPQNFPGLKLPCYCSSVDSRVMWLI